MSRSVENIAANCDKAPPRTYPSTYNLTDSSQFNDFYSDLTLQESQLKLTLDGKPSKQQKSPTFMLSGRQELILHRYTQFYDKKGILLLHGVGSGKTITSIAMALHSLDWAQERMDKGNARRITIVAPSGIYEQFIDTLTNIIPNINITTPGKGLYGFPTHKGEYLGRQVTFRGIKYSDLNKQFAASDNWQAMENLFKGDIVIFDEGHRLFRPIMSKTEAIIEQMTKRRVLKHAKRFIVMTGTPFNLEDSDILTMLKFIECNSMNTGDEKEDAKCYNDSRFNLSQFKNFGKKTGTWTDNLLASDNRTDPFDTWFMFFLSGFVFAGGIPAIPVVNIVQSAQAWFTSRMQDWKTGLIGIGDLFFGPGLNSRILNRREKPINAQFPNNLEEDDEEDENEEEDQRNSIFGALPYNAGGGGMTKQNAAILLGVNASANKSTIERAYKNAMRKYHPDSRHDTANKTLSLNQKTTKAKNITSAKNALLSTNAVSNVSTNMSNIQTILDSKLTSQEQEGLFARVYGVTSAPGYITYVENNSAMFEYLSAIPKEEVEEAFSLVIDYFKTNVLPSLQDAKGRITEDNIKRSADEVIQNFNAIEFETIMAEPLSTYLEDSKQSSMLTNQVGGMYIPGSWLIEGGSEALRRFKRYLLIKHDLLFPLDYKMLAEAALEYTSIIDVTMKKVDESIIGKIIEIDGIKHKVNGFNETNLDIIQKYIKEDAVVSGYTYPQKIVEFLFTQYTQDQQQFGSDVMGAKPEIRKTKHWDKKFGTNMKDSRNTATRSIGNYSLDFETFTAEYNSAALFPKYQLKDANYLTDEAIPSGTTMFECPKFIKVLQHLLIMKTGYMYTGKENKFIPHPHLTTSTKDKTLGRYKGQHGRPVCFGDDPYDLQQYPSHVPYTEYDAATHYYLPLVWSSNEIAGINLFAVFLESLGFKYIVLHAEAEKDVLEREKRRGLSRTYPLAEQSVRNEFKNLMTQIERGDFVDILAEINKLKEKVDKNDPICVLLHADMTEGIDCKFNPAIFLLEPPNTYGDYEQLCGRVLRTYGKPYAEVPKKIVYQMASYNYKDLREVVNKRNQWSDTVDMEGKSFLYDKSGRLTDAALIAWEQRKDSLGAYAPSSWYDGVKSAKATMDWKTWWDLSKQQLKAYVSLAEKTITFQSDDDKADVIVELQKLGIEKGKIKTYGYYSALTGNNYAMAVVNRSNEMMAGRLAKHKKDLESIQLRKEVLQQKQRTAVIKQIEAEEEGNVKQQYIDALLELNKPSMTIGSPDFDCMRALFHVEYYVTQLKDQLMKPSSILVQEALQTLSHSDTTKEFVKEGVKALMGSTIGKPIIKAASIVTGKQLSVSTSEPPKLPDLDQIRLFAMKKPGSQYLPWFRAFQYPTADQSILSLSNIQNITYSPTAEYTRLSTEIPTILTKYGTVSTQEDVQAIDQFYKDLAFENRKGLVTITFVADYVPSVVRLIKQQKTGTNGVVKILSIESNQVNCPYRQLEAAGYAFAKENADAAHENVACPPSITIVEDSQNAVAQNAGPRNAVVAVANNTKPRRSTRNFTPVVSYFPSRRTKKNSKLNTHLTKPALRQIIAKEKTVELSKAKDLIKSLVVSSNNIEPTCKTSIATKIDKINVSSPVSNIISPVAKQLPQPKGFWKKINEANNNNNSQVENNNNNSPAEIVNKLAAIKPVTVENPVIQPVVEKPAFNMNAFAKQLSANKAADNARKAADNARKAANEAARIASNEAELKSIPSNLQNLFRTVQHTRKNAANKKSNLNAKQRNAEGLSKALRERRTGKEKTFKAQNDAKRAKAAYNLAQQAAANARAAYNQANAARRTQQMQQNKAKGVSWAAKAAVKGGKMKTRSNKRVTGGRGKTYKLRRD